MVRKIETPELLAQVIDYLPNGLKPDSIEPGGDGVCFKLVYEMNPDDD